MTEKDKKLYPFLHHVIVISFSLKTPPSIYYTILLFKNEFLIISFEWLISDFIVLYSSLDVTLKLMSLV